MRENIRRPGEVSKPTPGLAATPSREGALAVGTDSESPTNGVGEGLRDALWKFVREAEQLAYRGAFDKNAPYEMTRRLVAILLNRDGGTRTAEVSANGADLLVAISRWIDDSPGYVGCDPEAVLWRRVTKASSEANEARDALAGLVGENPRKGVTHSRHDLIEELLDTAIAALGAVEHVTGNRGGALDLLNNKIVRVAQRAGLLVPTDRPAGDA